MSEGKNQQFHEKMFRLIDQFINPEKTFSRTTASLLLVKERQILRKLGEEKRSTMSALAAHVRVPLSTMTGIADKLVEKNLVKRIRSETDRRVVEVALTAGGEKVNEEEQIAFTHWFDSMFDQLNEKEKTQILGFLDKMLQSPYKD